MSSAEVVLVSMPWAPPTEPSLALGILKSRLAQERIGCKVIHAAPALLEWLSIDTYEFVAECWGLSEFLFAAAVDPDLDDGQVERLIERCERYVAASRHPRYASVTAMCDLMLTLRDVTIPTLIERVVDRVLEQRPSLIGFTCMFDQTLASIATATVIKSRRPDVPVILGGYALEGPPGERIREAFPIIDAIVLGDGENTLPSLVNQALRGEPLQSPTLDRARIVRGDKVDLNTSPSPDYDDWFSDVARLERDAGVEIHTRVLPVEASRGCWWGQQKHCVFCGIDDNAMQYRYKQPAAVLEMLQTLRARYGDHVFRFSDYIMPKAYYTELLPQLEREQPRFRLQSEIKANQPPARVQQFARAGYIELQPGIESFSTEILLLMDKGVRAIDNVALLKAAYLNRIVLDYNILYGIPGETDEAYVEMLANIPKLYHLTPPVSRNETVVTRFAPLQQEPKRFGITKKARAHPAYDVLFSDAFRWRTNFNLTDYAYYFQRTFEYSESLDALHALLTLQVDHWKAQHRSGAVELSYVDDGDSLQFRDSRFGPAEEYVVRGLAAEVYRASDALPTNRTKAPYQLSKGHESAVCHAIDELDQRRLLWHERDLIFGLGVPRAVYDAHLRDSWFHSWMSVYSAQETRTETPMEPTAHLLTATRGLGDC